MKQNIYLLILATLIIGLLLVSKISFSETIDSMHSNSVTTVNQEEQKTDLLSDMKKPLISDILSVKQTEESYSGKEEFYALYQLRDYMEKVSKYSIEGVADEGSKETMLASAKYKNSSTVNTSDWTAEHREQFSMPIIVWSKDSPTIEQVGYRDYISEIRRNVSGKILGYFEDGEKDCYVIIGNADVDSFQIFRLNWSDRSLPHFEGYRFTTGLDSIPESQAQVFSPEFLLELRQVLIN